MQSFYRTSLTVDTNNTQKYFEEDSSSILDDNVLDQGALDSGLEMSPPMADSRRDSFGVPSALFSPKTEDWHSVEMQSLPSNNPFLDPHSSNNPFMRLDQHQQPPAYSAQGPSWSMTNSGTATPLQAFDGLPTEFDPNASIFQRPPTMQGPAPFSNPAGQVTMFQQLAHPSSQSIPTSPQKNDWMGPGLKDQAMAKRNRPAGDLIRSHNELRRGDGIRKKNARFDIPAERNLSNIDHLISQSTDEQEVKELKQQKRLLRNRQAALDSRQRKKQHTERLEDEKKQFTEVIGQMEQEMDDLKAQMEQLLREKQQYTEYIETINLEKEERIRAHTIETGELRKKVSILTNHVQTLEGTAMAAAPAVPNPSGFPGTFGNEMEGLAMDSSWDNMPLFGDFALEQPNEVKQKVQVTIPVKKPEVSLPADVEKPSQQGGLLFMLFLVGAFVMSSGSTQPIPNVSDDVREASATLLENVLKDAGVSQPSSSLVPMAPQPSGTGWARTPAPSMSVGSAGMEGVTTSMLGELTDTLTQPTQEQSNEQVFSISAAQYNGVSSQDFLQNPPAERSTSQGRRNLAEALANMRNSNKNSAAEVYTRSLLWDQIPSDVVRTFARMVAECNPEGGGGPQACGNDGET